MLSRFHLIPERYGQTDRQTDRFAISISRVSVLTGDKNQNNGATRWWKSLRICITVLTEYRRVTDRQTDILQWRSPRYAYASRGNNCYAISTVDMTLNERGKYRLKQTTVATTTYLAHIRQVALLIITSCYYGRPLSVSGRPCYILPMFFYLFIYLFFMAALFSGPG